MPIGGLLDALMGKVNFQARAPRIDTRAGSEAIQARAQRGGAQALSGAYSAASSARGGNQALAFREAQRLGLQQQGQIYGQALEAQKELEQQAAMQRANAEMQAQQINAGIAQNNAQGMSKLAGAALMGAAMMSDQRQKEVIYSDFLDKEAPAPQPMRTTTLRPGAGRESLYSRALTLAAGGTPPAQVQPQLLRPGVATDALSRPVVSQHLADRREAMFDKDQAAIAAAADQGPSALQTLGVTPQQGTYAQALKDAGQLTPVEAQARQQNRDEIAKLRGEMQADRKQQGLLALGQNLMSSDFVDKEPPDSREALAPVRPVVFRYTPESSYRQALEAARAPSEVAPVFADKREPRPGILAQDLERSDELRPAVVSTQTGKKVIQDRALSTALGLLADMNRRVSRIEKGKGRRAA